MYLRECGTIGLQARIQTSDCRDKEAEDALEYCISNGDSFSFVFTALEFALQPFITSNGSRYFLM